jgi:hypothetical protein
VEQFGISPIAQSNRFDRKTAIYRKMLLNLVGKNSERNGSTENGKIRKGIRSIGNTNIRHHIQEF